MSIQRTVVTIFLIITLPVWIVACGGGGGGESTTALKGVFVDSVVEGIRYKTMTHEGTTDSNGAYTYEPGEQIQFYIGDILLGGVMGKAEITPIDLVPGATNPTHPHVTNILRFIQSLDADRNPDNGIKIPTIVSTQAAGQSMNFYVDTTTFEAQAQAIIDFLSSGAITTLIDIESAQAHMFNSIGLLTSVTILPSVQGSAEDEGPQDGIFDSILTAPNDHLLNNNGFVQIRYISEFDISDLPADIVIISARFQTCIGVFEGPRQIELHSYPGDGILSLADYAQNGLVSKNSLPAIGYQLLNIEVSDQIIQMTENQDNVAGFGVRENHLNGNPNFTVMSVGEACSLTTNPVQLVVHYVDSSVITNPGATKQFN